MKNDLNCDGDGLLINASRIAIDLNGPGIKSSTVGIIANRTESVTIIGPGAIQNFASGVLITESNKIMVQRVTFDDNERAVFMKRVTNSTIEQNLVGPNQMGFIAYASDKLNIHANLMSSNNLVGIGFLNSDTSEVIANSIGGSASGIFLDSESENNAIQFNDVRGNTVDINNANGLTQNMNEFNKNNCDTSTPHGICTQG